jgi:hypothetical protein
MTTDQRARHAEAQRRYRLTAKGKATDARERAERVRSGRAAREQQRDSYRLAAERDDALLAAMGGPSIDFGALLRRG